ncbi:MAG: glycosyltransferase family 2 protein [Acidobacteria bacterium]|nr:glycosyltransferase family 2 protein [Acidobacteriota bacterium]
MNKISVIVTTYRAVSYLRCCIDSLIRSLSPEKFEVVIYGDGGGAQSEQEIEICRTKLRVAGIDCTTRYNADNLGICPALNRAVAMASGDWLLFINDDMVFPKTWVARVEPLLVPGRVLSLVAIEPSLPGRRPAGCFYSANLGLHPTTFDFARLDRFQEALSPTPLTVGVNYPFCVEKKLFVQVGAVDEQFPGPYHDPDLFLRFSLIGAALVRSPWCALYHFSGVSLRFSEVAVGAALMTTGRQSLEWIRKENQGRRIFIEKWGVKPKARFGDLPRVQVKAPWNQRSPTGWESFMRQWNLYWEGVRGRLREFRYRSSLRS